MASKGPRTGAKKPVAKTPIAKVAAPVVEPKPEPVVEAVAAPVEPVAEVAAPVIEEIVEPVVETVAEAVETVAAPVTQIIEDTAPQMADTASKGIYTMEAIEKSQAMFAELNDKAKAAVEKNTKLVGEMTELAKGNVEALVESGKIAAKGLETLGQDAAEYSRKQFEQATATMKSLAAVKSPADFFKLQSDYVRSTFDSMVAETSKNTEAFIKLAGDAAQPVSNRVAVAMEKIKTAA
ncbi:MULTISPECIES: phasin family protein [unclassified Sphingomonas]|uniref:phasin family protein n=1 Tax=unclassified Sphingomonas TaxID=196159 RepID=UPI0008362190|nr:MULTISPECIES: phasin family protein [unclassified Sphingomonas]